MLTGWPTPLLQDAVIEELRFQARIHGYSTDDLVCTLLDDAGGRRKVLLQIKLTLKAIPSDQPFKDAIVAAWYDYSNDTLFKRGRDRLVIVYANDVGGGIQAAGQLTQFARTSLTSAEFVRKATAEGFSSDARRAAHESIVKILETELEREVAPDELHDFMRHLRFVSHQLASDSTQELSEVLGRIKVVLGQPLGAYPQGVWSELATTCQRLNGEAASLSFSNLDEQLSARLAAAFARHRTSTAARLPLDELVPERALGVVAESGVVPEFEEEVSLFKGVTVHRPASAAAEVGITESRLDSGNKAISGLLDAINEKLKQFRYQDALDDVLALGKDLGPFDQHQKARWYLQRGVCQWHLGDSADAAADFLKSEELFPDDEKTAAAGIRGRMLQGDFPGAVASGKAAMERFPSSLTVWASYANAQMASGVHLTITDVPAIHRKDADALQLLSHSRRLAKDWKGAVEAAMSSLESSNAGFYSRASALATILEGATANKVLSTYRLVDGSTKEGLLKAMAAFDPHVDRLWNVQAPVSVAEAASNLGVAFLLTDNAEGALRLVQEAEAHGVQSQDLLRVELEALHQANQVPEMLARGRKHLARLGEDALVVLAQAGANVGDVALVDEVVAAAQKVSLSRPETVQVLRAVRWLALWNASDRDTAKKEALAADLSTTDSLPLIIAGVRVLLQSDADVVAAAIARGEAIVAKDPIPENTILFADMLFEAREYGKAAPYYERVVPQGRVSELHNRLLCCYVRTGDRRKAKKLIETFPEGWVNDDGARSLAIELGQDVGDWPLLKVLADAQFRRQPMLVTSWLFKHMVGVRSLSAVDIQEFLANAPLELDGTIQQTAQLAAQEMRYGLREKGMQRMYRLRRLTSADVESASALLITFLSIPELLPNMEESLPEVVAGSHFVATEADGQRIDVTIDPPSLPDLPETTEFKHPTSADVAAFLGRKPGDEVALEGGFRTRRTLKVESVGSAYRRLLDLARHDMDRSLAPVPHATSVPIGTTATGEADFSQMHEQLKLQSAHSKEAFQRYKTAPITLGGFARLTGKNPVDIIRGWPTNQDAPPLFVTGGTVDERQAAFKHLRDPSAGYVVDASTLTELVNLDAAAALAALPKVFATTDTRDLLRGCLEEAKLERSNGRVFDDDGQMRFVEFTEEDHARNVKHLQAILDALETHCEVVPSYGPEANPELLSRLEKALSDEEHAVLRLAAEKNLCLLTVDGRLRHWASAVGISGVWPQVLLMHAGELGLITPRVYSMAAVRMFLSNRSFVSLAPQDLLLMCHQGTPWARQGLARFKRYLADPATEFQSAFKTTLDFIGAAAFACTYMGAIAELLRHLVEGLMRHKDCPDDVLDLVETFVRDMLGNGSANPYPAIKRAEQSEKQAQLRYLATAMVEGLTWAKQPPQERPIRLKVFVGGRTPWMVSGGDDTEPDAPRVKSSE
jgi:tetratricopeptide (TPR) repeat protein